MRGAAFAAAALLALAVPGTGHAEGDPEAGKSAFNRVCGACHSVAAGQNKVGPSLHAVVGRESGTAPNFNYSPAMRDAHKTWDEATLNAYLENPRAYIPNNRMILAGVRSEQDRQNIIAYLSQQK